LKTELTQTNGNEWDSVELELEEMEEAVNLAKKEKFFRLRREAYKLQMFEEPKYITETSLQLMDEFAKRFQFADVDHGMKVKNICRYFANETGDLDLKKGLLLIGNKGTGKTELIRMFKANQNFPFRIEAILDLQFDYKMNGEKGLQGYNINFKSAPNKYGLSDYGYCFDDLGTEEIPARHFAESKNIFSEIIQMRYHNQLPFNSTHAITNKSLAELKELYGSRCADRMQEMFNVISFNHESFRQQN